VALLLTKCAAWRKTDETVSAEAAAAAVKTASNAWVQRPGRGGVAGDAEHVHGAGADLHDHEHVQPSQEHGVNVEKVRGEQAGDLGAQELAPGRVPPRLRGMGPRPALRTDAADGRGAAALPGHHRIWVLSGPGQHRKADARDTIVWRPVRADYTMQREWKVGVQAVRLYTAP
jgi:hypothetical protein